METLTERGYGVGLEEQRLSLDLLRLQEHGARLEPPQHAEALLQNHISTAMALQSVMHEVWLGLCRVGEWLQILVPFQRNGGTGIGL